MENSWFKRRKECPACKSDNYKIIYRSPYDRPPLTDYLTNYYSYLGVVEFEYLDGAEYILCECGECRLIFQRDIPGDVLMERLYERWMDPIKTLPFEQKEHWGLEYYCHKAQEVMQIIAYLGKIPADLSFFDFGMGWGAWAHMAGAFGCDTYGSEISPERIKYAIGNGVKLVEWSEIPNLQFDCINANEVIEHIPDPVGALRHLAKALKLGGILKLSVPHATDAEERIKKMDWGDFEHAKSTLKFVAPLEHINFFRRSSLIKMVHNVGLREVCIPVRCQWKHSTNWGGLKKTAKNIIRPIQTNYIKKWNTLFLSQV